MTSPLRVALLALGLLAAACGGDDRVNVFAASSLTDVLPSIVDRYREQHPAVDFNISFAGSQTLATQIEEGASADVFISANPAQARRLVDAGLVERAAVFLENRLVLAVSDDAPWRSVEEVAAAGARIAVGAPGVPVGALAVAALDLLEPELADRLREGIVTEDPNVRVVLSRVELGEVDAAFVYETDLKTARGVRAIALPEELPRNEYVAVLVARQRDAAIGDAAAAFLDFLSGVDGDGAAGALRAAGFQPVEARPFP